MIEVPGFPPITEGACRVVAEIGNPPTVEAALELAAAAAAAGAYAVKGQLLTADTLVTADAPSYGMGLAEPVRQRDAFARSLPYSAWGEVKDLCDELGVVFFASCWDEAAVDACEEMGVPLYKVGSADITHERLIRHVAATGKPIVLSTGASYADEIERAYEWIAKETGCWCGSRPEADVVLLACTLSYPCDNGDANILRMMTLRDTFGGMVGYSDHTRATSAGLLATQHGAVMVEKHFTTTPNAGGDHDFAADEAGLQQLTFRPSPVVVYGPHVTRLAGDGHLEPMPVEANARRQARRSIAAARDITQGDIIGEDDLAYLRPGTGIEPFRWRELVGRAAPVDVPAGTLIPKSVLGAAGSLSR